MSKFQYGTHGIIKLKRLYSTIINRYLVHLKGNYKRVGKMAMKSKEASRFTWGTIIVGG